MKFKRIYIELSNYCNLNCVFCTPKDKNSRMMTYKQFIDVFTKVKDYSDEFCLHVLGEPTIHKEFSNIVKYINSFKKNIMLSTNGRYLTKVKDIYDLDIKTFNISLHSTYNMDDLKRNEFINELLAFIDTYNNTHNSVFHLRLWADTNEVIKNNNLKIKELLFNHYDYHDQVKERIRLKERVILSYDEEFVWPNISDSHMSDSFCLGGKTHVAILADGKTVMCCLDSSGLTNVGNIFEQSFEDILNGKLFNEALKQFRNNKCYLNYVSIVGIN